MSLKQHGPNGMFPGSGTALFVLYMWGTGRCLCQEPVDIVTPVATILNQTVRFTIALIKINWQAG